MNPPDQPLEDIDEDVAAATEARLEAYAAAMAGTPEGEEMDREWGERMDREWDASTPDERERMVAP